LLLTNNDTSEIKGIALKGIPKPRARNQGRTEKPGEKGAKGGASSQADNNRDFD
jgi:hypothetical protein